MNTENMFRVFAEYLHIHETYMLVWLYWISREVVIQHGFAATTIPRALLRQPRDGHASEAVKVPAVCIQPAFATNRDEETVPTWMRPSRLLSPKEGRKPFRCTCVPAENRW